jgi:DNA polymerase-3 subunit beta
MFKSTKERLAGPLTLISSVVDAKPTIPAYEYILMEGSDGDLWLTASNMETTVVTNVETETEGDFACLVPARHFTSLVSLFGGDFTVAEEKEGTILVRHGKSKHRLKVLTRDSFPEVHAVQGKSVSLTGNLLRNMIRATEFAIDSHSDSKFPAMKGIQILVADGNLHMVGCDGMRMGIATVPMNGDFEVVVPARSIGVFSKFANGPGEVEIVPQENQVSLRGENGHVISRRIVGQFPNWQLIVPKEFHHEIIIPIDAFTMAIKRVGLSTNSHDSGAEPAFACKLTISCREMMVEARSPERGEGLEYVDVQCPGLAQNEDPIVVGIAGKQVLEFLKLLETGTLVMKYKPSSPIVFVPKTTLGFDYSYLTMPVLLKW